MAVFQGCILFESVDLKACYLRTSRFTNVGDPAQREGARFHRPPDARHESDGGRIRQGMDGRVQQIAPCEDDGQNDESWPLGLLKRCRWKPEAKPVSADLAGYL